MIAPNDRSGTYRDGGDEHRERDAIPLDHAQTPLWDELGQHLDREGRGDLELLREELRHVPWCNTPAGDSLQRALERADAAELIVLAQRLGREWLAAS